MKTLKTPGIISALILTESAFEYAQTQHTSHRRLRGSQARHSSNAAIAPKWWLVPAGAFMKGSPADEPATMNCRTMFRLRGRSQSGQSKLHGISGRPAPRSAVRRHRHR